MVFPDKKQYFEDAKSFKIIPVFKEVAADFETPLSVFLKVQAKFLLESIERGENVGRYSMVGLGKKCSITLRGPSIEIVENKGQAEARIQKELRNPLEEVRKCFSEWKAPAYEGLPPFYGGAIGYLGYEAVRYFEDIPVSRDRDAIPDGLMVIPEVLLVYDSVKRSLFIVVSTLPGDNPEREFETAVKKIEQIVRLIRSKGIVIYFVTHNPLDVPDVVLGQLGNRIQHAFRAFTPRDQKSVRAVRRAPGIDHSAASRAASGGKIKDTIFQTIGKSAMRSVGYEIERQITRGILGSILGGRRR